jgi:hypothetical protein
MPIPKLYLYKARDVPIVAILRRGLQRDEWELIKWDLETDTFTEGQWITHKQMNGRYCAISPNGNYFAYIYNEYTKSIYSARGVISRIPNFTAIYYTDRFPGYWDKVGFNTDNSVCVSPEKGWQLKTPDSEIQTSSVKDYVPSGYISSEVWIDPRGRSITTEKGVVIANGVPIYDTTHHMFVPKAVI